MYQTTKSQSKYISSCSDCPIDLDFCLKCSAIKRNSYFMFNFSSIRVVVDVSAGGRKFGMNRKVSPSQREIQMKNGKRMTSTLPEDFATLLGSLNSEVLGKM